MRLGKIQLIMVIAILMILMLAFTSAVYSDSQNGWKGYGLFNINNSKITIMSEDASIELTNDKLNFNGEYVIRNTTNNAIKVYLGMPANGIEKISMMEKGYYIKWKKRSLESLQYEFKIENQLPQEEYWYVFSLSLNPTETRVINVSMDAAQQFNTQGIYSVSYFGDRRLGFSNKAEKSSLYMKVNGFEPYNILSVKGLDPDEIGKNGEIFIETDEKSMETITLQHKDILSQAIDKLMRSPMYKAREIALTFLDKDYDKVSSLCDEYLKNPTDNQISKEQIYFIKAESLRRLYKPERYLEIVETMDYSKLYPVELKNKVYLDRVNLYRAQQNKEKIDSLSKELYQQTDDSSEFIAAWLEDNGYFNLSDTDKAKLINDKLEEVEASGQPIDILKKWYYSIVSIPYTPVIIFAAGLLIGLLIRKGTTRKKRKRSMYIYRM